MRRFTPVPENPGPVPAGTAGAEALRCCGAQATPGLHGPTVRAPASPEGCEGACRSGRSSRSRAAVPGVPLCQRRRRGRRHQRQGRAKEVPEPATDHPGRTAVIRRPTHTLVNSAGTARMHRSLARSAAFPPREHTGPAPRPPSGRGFAPHRQSAASPSSTASAYAAVGARHPDGSAPAAVRPSAASTRAIAAGSWIAASTRRGPAHSGQTSTSMPNVRRSRSAHGKRCRRLRRRPPRCGTHRRAQARRCACWRHTAAAAGVAGVAALSAPAA
jgi:hypothetical protein